MKGTNCQHSNKKTSLHWGYHSQSTIEGGYCKRRRPCRRPEDDIKNCTSQQHHDLWQAVSDQQESVDTDRSYLGLHSPNEDDHMTRGVNGYPLASCYPGSKIGKGSSGRMPVKSHSPSLGSLQQMTGGIVTPLQPQSHSSPVVDRIISYSNRGLVGCRERRSRWRFY